MADITTGTNSYVSIDEAETYFDARLHASTWNEASDDDKARALIMAATLLDRHVVWLGAKATSTQAMEWPRQGVDISSVPPSVKMAQMELALALLKRDLTAQPDEPGIKRQKVDVIEQEFFQGADAVQVIPDSIFALVAAYGRRTGGLTSVTLCR